MMPMIRTAAPARLVRRQSAASEGGATRADRRFRSERPATGPVPGGVAWAQ